MFGGWINELTRQLRKGEWEALFLKVIKTDWDQYKDAQEHCFQAESAKMVCLIATLIVIKWLNDFKFEYRDFSAWAAEFLNSFGMYNDKQGISTENRKFEFGKKFELTLCVL